MDISKTSDLIKIKIKIPNPSQEPPASSKAPNDDLNEMNDLCTIKIKINMPNTNLKLGLKGHGWSLHLQNEDREPQFGSWVYQRPVTISKS